MRRNGISNTKLVLNEPDINIDRISLIFAAI